VQDNAVRILIKEEVDRIHSIMGLIPLDEQTIGGMTPIGGLSMSGIFNPLFGIDAYNWFKSFDRHDWASFIEITTGLLGMIPTPASPVLLGISVAAGLTDAAFYFNEGDPYMGGLMVALAILPAAEFIKAVPAAKPILDKGSSYVKNLLKKVRSLSGKKGLKQSEKQAIKEVETLIEATAKNADELGKAVAKKTVSQVIKGVIKLSGKALWATVKLLSRLSWAIGKPLVMVAGIYYTYDEVYLALYGSDEDKLKLRYNSRFQGLVRALKVLTNYESAEKQAEEFLIMNGSTIEENPELLAQIDYTQKQKALDEQNKETVRALEEQKKQQKNSPSFQDVLSKKIDNYTNQPYTIHEGQKGDSVKKMQQMLDKLDLGIVLKGYEEGKNGSDSVFGNNTYEAVVIFQSNNGLSETGIVDSKTLSKMIKLYKEKGKNEK
jgi:hypothetical protein